VLKPHVRTPDQPEADVTVAYGEAKGSLEPVANALRAIKLLEAVAVHTAETLVWPTPKRKAAAFPMRAGISRNTSSSHVANWPQILPTFIAAMAQTRCRSARCRLPHEAMKDFARQRLVHRFRGTRETCAFLLKLAVLREVQRAR
jgi:hypothetical protein